MAITDILHSGSICVGVPYIDFYVKKKLLSLLNITNIEKILTRIYATERI